MRHPFPISLLLLLFAFRTAAADSPHWLPFQAQLVQADGKAVSGGSRVVRFQIFSAPVAGNLVWEGELHRTTVNHGLINVILGTKSSLKTVDFATTLYLEITVDSAGVTGAPDGLITADDPPLMPRQILVPPMLAVEAVSSRDAQRVQGFRVDEIPSAVPVGGVLMWWGRLDSVPTGFEVCDGNPTSTPGAKLVGLKPDLRDRFPKGALPEALDVQGSPVLGGSHLTPESVTGLTTLTIDQMPSHKHTIDLVTTIDGEHSHPFPIGRGDGDPRNMAADGENLTKRVRTDSAGAHAHRVVGDSNPRGGDQPHLHALPARDNRPAFLEMFFIIRVK